MFLKLVRQRSLCLAHAAELWVGRHFQVDSGRGDSASSSGDLAEEPCPVLTGASEQKFNPFSVFGREASRLREEPGHL
ncbi:MAG: hypothetical protein M3N98_07910 [Actinomycetota bacterium]|nr:hypothetical protein [Actinomycetota bacterium]